MATPSYKDPTLESWLENNFKRTSSINNNVCVPAPIGCGGPATEFNDEQSKQEYLISGWCQKCQDAFFGKNPSYPKAHDFPAPAAKSTEK